MPSTLNVSGTIAGAHITFMPTFAQPPSPLRTLALAKNVQDSRRPSPRNPRQVGKDGLPFRRIQMPRIDGKRSCAVWDPVYKLLETYLLPTN